LRGFTFPELFPAGLRIRVRHTARRYRSTSFGHVLRAHFWRVRASPPFDGFFSRLARLSRGLGRYVSSLKFWLVRSRSIVCVYHFRTCRVYWRVRVLPSFVATVRIPTGYRVCVLHGSRSLLDAAAAPRAKHSHITHAAPLHRACWFSWFARQLHAPTGLRFLLRTRHTCARFHTHYGSYGCRCVAVPVGSRLFTDYVVRTFTTYVALHVVPRYYRCHCVCVLFARHYRIPQLLGVHYVCAFTFRHQLHQRFCVLRTTFRRTAFAFSVVGSLPFFAPLLLPVLRSYCVSLRFVLPFCRVRSFVAVARLRFRSPLRWSDITFVCVAPHRFTRAFLHCTCFLGVRCCCVLPSLLPSTCAFLRFSVIPFRSHVSFSRVRCCCGAFARLKTSFAFVPHCVLSSRSFSLKTSDSFDFARCVLRYAFYALQRAYAPLVTRQQIVLRLYTARSHPLTVWTRLHSP